MKKRTFFIIILFFLISCQPLKAQHWYYHDPTLWYDVNTIAFPAAGVIAVGGGWETHDSMQIMFQSSNYGLTWNENAHDGLAPWNKSIAFSDSMNGIGVGNDGRIIRTSDAGQNWGWNQVPIDRDLNKVFYAGAGKYYVVGGNKTNDSIQTILKSDDYGFNWNLIYDTMGPMLRSIYFFDTLKGIAVGNQGTILGTLDGGNTWSAITAPLQRDYNGITFINTDTGYIVGGKPNDTCRRTILRSTDGGANWIVLIDATGGVLKDISFASAGIGYAVGDSSTVLQTTDGGLSWSPIVIDASLTGNETFNAVKFLDRTFGAVAGKAGLLYIYQNGPVELYTFGISQLGTTDATLQGEINTHSANAKYSFVYSVSPVFNAAVTTSGTDIQNNSLELISEHISGLAPNTTYYYFLKAATASDTIYGDTLNFYTGINPPCVFQTLDATGVSTGGAYLNGLIYKFPAPVNLFFEYGTSPAFGSQIAANPSMVNDSLMHNIQVLLTPLQVHEHYFFRLKGVTGTGTYYGDTKMFIVENLPMVSTGYASNVTLTSAQLNGNVNNNGSPTAIKFEYGLTTLYGSEVNAFPDTVLGFNNVNASCPITGLTSFMTYHFRIKCINANGISYGGDMTFISGGPEVHTYSATNIGVNSAQLDGTINANGFLTANKFEWGATVSYGNEVVAVPDSSTGVGNVNISYLLSGLSSNTTYHYRAKAVFQLGTVYGNDMEFQTGILWPTATTQTATEITVNSAKLNATVNPNHAAVDIKFDYGLTTSYGSEIDANPASSSDSADISVFADVSGLISNQYYHFRIIVILFADTIFGNDLIFFTGNSEIPNFDFEIWNTPAIDFPDGWTKAQGLVTKYSPACSGNYALKVQNTTDGGIGVVMLGFVGESIYGGVPFNARPDSLTGCFKYNIDINDTSWIGVILKKNGNPISFNLCTIVGNSGGNFTNLKFPLQYGTSDIPDSLIMFISSSNFNQKTHSPNSWLIADNIRFTGTSLNVPDNDFEQWHTEIGLDLAGWDYKGRGIIPPDTAGTSGVLRTTDAEYHTYAARLKTSFLPGGGAYGGGSTYGSLESGNDGNQKIPVNARHLSLTGYYKFFPQNNDTMSGSVSMYKNGAQIGAGFFLQHDLIGTYTPFVINISYTTSDIPDSAAIMISAFKQFPPLGSSVLYLDNLNFDGFLSGIKESPLMGAGGVDFNVYPNPFSQQATVSFTIAKDEDVTVRLFDLSGKPIAILANGRYKPGNHQLDLPAAGLSKGFYICVINTADEVRSKKIIIF